MQELDNIVIIDIREWKLTDDDIIYIAERLFDYSTIIIEPTEYQKIKNVTYQDKLLYVRKDDNGQK